MIIVEYVIMRNYAYNYICILTTCHSLYSSTRANSCNFATPKGAKVAGPRYCHQRLGSPLGRNEDKVFGGLLVVVFVFCGGECLGRNLLHHKRLPNKMVAQHVFSLSLSLFLSPATGEEIREDKT